MLGSRWWGQDVCMGSTWGEGQGGGVIMTGLRSWGSRYQNEDTGGHKVRKGQVTDNDKEMCDKLLNKNFVSAREDLQIEL